MERKSDDPLIWWRWISLLVLPVAVALSVLAVGLRSENVGVALLLLVLAWVGPRARRFSLFGAALALTAIIYDAFPLLDGLRRPIVVDGLYLHELRWFGIPTATGHLLPNQWLLRLRSVPLDVVFGGAYALYLVELVAVSFYLYVRDRPRAFRLAYAFFAAYLLGFAVWVVFPAAPPWYVETYGLGPAQLDAIPSAAGTAAFDHILGIHYFAGFYARNTNVFGAMPSLHVATALVVFLATARKGWTWAVGTALFALWIAVAAVYLQHHYVLDVIGGALTAVLAFGLTVGAERGYRALTSPRVGSVEAMADHGRAHSRF